MHYLSRYGTWLLRSVGGAVPGQVVLAAFLFFTGVSASEWLANKAASEQLSSLADYRTPAAMLTANLIILAIVLRVLWSMVRPPRVVQLLGRASQRLPAEAVGWFMMYRPGTIDPLRTTLTPFLLHISPSTDGYTATAAITTLAKDKRLEFEAAVFVMRGNVHLLAKEAPDSASTGRFVSVVVGADGFERHEAVGNIQASNMDGRPHAAALIARPLARAMSSEEVQRAKAGLQYITVGETTSEWAPYSRSAKSDEQAIWKALTGGTRVVGTVIATPSPDQAVLGDDEGSRLPTAAPQRS